MNGWLIFNHFGSAWCYSKNLSFQGVLRSKDMGENERISEDIEESAKIFEDTLQDELLAGMAARTNNTFKAV